LAPAPTATDYVPASKLAGKVTTSLNPRFMLRLLDGLAAEQVRISAKHHTELVWLEAAWRDKGRILGSACHECGKLPDDELIDKTLRRVAEQIAAQGGGGYEGVIVTRPLGIVGGALDAFVRKVSEIAEDKMKEDKCFPANTVPDRSPSRTLSKRQPKVCA
jgi:hypothetical protein